MAETIKGSTPLAFSSLALTAAGGASQAVGSYYAAIGEKQALGLQADIDAINARIAEGQARDSLARGEKEYGKSRIDTANLKGKQIAGFGANNVDIGFGSAAAVLTGTDYMGEVDAETIKANASREAWGHRLEATNLRSSSAVNRAGAKGINPGATLISSLMTEAGTVAKSYYGLKSSGALSGGKKSSSSGNHSSSHSRGY